MALAEYILRGGEHGRERLRVLSNVLRPTTLQLFRQAGLTKGMNCIDLGCGGGDVCFDIAAMIGEQAKIVGIDIDPLKIAAAQKEAADKNFPHIEFINSDIFNMSVDHKFDMAYARFLLTHLGDPLTALKRMYDHLAPGGIAIVEDIDFRGHFCFPEHTAFNRYVQLYSEASLVAGGDPFIGPKLPGLMQQVGFSQIEINLIQPAGITGEVKYLAAITMENIADAVLKAGLASRDAIDDIIDDLNQMAKDDHTLVSMPRIIQVRGTRQEK